MEDSFSGTGFWTEVTARSSTMALSGGRTMSDAPSFRPAKPWGWVVRVVRTLNHLRNARGPDGGLAPSLYGKGARCIRSCRTNRSISGVSNSDSDQSGDAVFDGRDRLQITLSSIGDRDRRADYLKPLAGQRIGWTVADAAGVAVEKVFRIINETMREPVEQPVRMVIECGLTVGQGNVPFSVESTTHRSPAGLGMALVKNLVEMHGGGVRVASEGVGLGSEFCVRLLAAVR